MRQIRPEKANVDEFDGQIISPNLPGTYPTCQVYRYVPPQGVWFLSHFGLKMGIDFEHFGLKLGMVIGGTFTKAYKPFFLPTNWVSNW